MYCIYSNGSRNKKKQKNKEKRRLGFFLPSLSACYYHFLSFYDKTSSVIDLVSLIINICRWEEVLGLQLSHRMYKHLSESERVKYKKERGKNQLSAGSHLPILYCRAHNPRRQRARAPFFLPLFVYLFLYLYTRRYARNFVCDDVCFTTSEHEERTPYKHSSVRSICDSAPTNSRLPVASIRELFAIPLNSNRSESISDSFIYTIDEFVAENQFVFQVCSGLCLYIYINFFSFLRSQEFYRYFVSSWSLCSVVLFFSIVKSSNSSKIEKKCCGICIKRKINKCFISSSRQRPLITAPPTQKTHTKSSKLYRGILNLAALRDSAHSARK